MKYENPWETTEEGFHDTGGPDDKLHYLLRYAVLAPSGHNTQPWIFKVGNHQVQLYADRTRCLPVVDPHDRELIISCGAALGTLEVALRYFGYTGKIILFPESNEPDHLATIELGDRYERTEDDRKLFHAIQDRRTNRRKYEDRRVPAIVLEECRKLAKEYGVDLLVSGIKNPAREDIAELIEKGDREQFGNISFRRELASWIHPRRGSTHDGMAPYSMGATKILDPLAPFMAMVIRRFDLGDGRAATDKDLAEHCPALGILTTPDDTPKDWMMTGRALAKVLLCLTANGATASYLNQPIEVSELRSNLKEKCGLDGIAQLLLRIGYGPKIEPAARRPMTEVVRFI